MPRLAVALAGLPYLVVLALAGAAPVVLAVRVQAEADLVVGLAAEVDSEALVDLLSRPSFSPAMARNTT